jgi:hypothetical protein
LDLDEVGFLLDDFDLLGFFFDDLDLLDFFGRFEDVFFFAFDLPLKTKQSSNSMNFYRKNFT